MESILSIESIWRIKEPIRLERGIVKNLTPTILATIVLVVLVIAATIVTITGHQLPQGSDLVFMSLLTFVFGVQVPNNPMKG